MNGNILLPPALSSYLPLFFIIYFLFVDIYCTRSCRKNLHWEKQYTETMNKMKALDDGNLSTEEALYYAEVTGRISEKLIEVVQ